MFKGLFYQQSKDISFSHKERKASDIKYIVVHYTANTTDNAKDNAHYFANGNTVEAGAHFFVDENEIYYTIPLKYPAFSVGTKAKKVTAKLFKKCTNFNSINIELCSTDFKVLDGTLDNAEKLIKELMFMFNIPKERIVRHYDVTGKICPGWPGWFGADSRDWYKFKLRFMKG